MYQLVIVFEQLPFKKSDISHFVQNVLRRLFIYCSVGLFIHPQLRLVRLCFRTVCMWITEKLPEFY